MKFIPHYRCEISLIEQHRGGTCVLVKTRQLHPNACLFSFCSKNSYAMRMCIVHHSILSSLLSFVSRRPEIKYISDNTKGLSTRSTCTDAAGVVCRGEVTVDCSVYKTLRVRWVFVMRCLSCKYCGRILYRAVMDVCLLHHRSFKSNFFISSKACALLE